MNPLRDVIRWREEVGRSLLNLDFCTEGDHPFRFQMAPVLVGKGVRVVQNAHGPGYTFRDDELLRDGNNCLAIVYPRRGILNFTQEGGGTLRSSGEAKLLICDRPGQLGAASPCDYVSIILQPEDLPAGLDLKQLASQPWAATRPALTLLRSYVEALNSTCILPDSDLAQVVQQHILDLVRLAALERSQADPSDLLAASTIGEARLRIAREDIAKRFRDPSLSEGAIAARQGISTRQLQRIFEAAGTTFTGMVHELRLQAASDALANPLQSSLSVAEIAMAAGFSDISYFNRLFRRRFGMTPSEARRSRR